jgi:hypothetical protein
MTRKKTEGVLLKIYGYETLLGILQVRMAKQKLKLEFVSQKKLDYQPHK